MGVAEALREEYRAIVDAGLHVQVDDAFIPFMYDVLVPPGTMDDYLAWAQPRIDAVNHALEGIPEDRVRYHVCWGSWNGPHTNDIALRDILPLILAGQRRHVPVRARQPAPRARVARLGGRRAAGRQEARARASSATRRTSSSTPSSSPSASSGSRASSGRSASSRAPTAASPRGRSCAASTRRSSGRSSRRSPRAPRSRRATSRRSAVASKRCTTSRGPSRSICTSQRTPAEGTCRECGKAELATYRVLSDGGWWDVCKCQSCLASVSRERAPMFGELHAARTEREGLSGPVGCWVPM